MQALHMNGSFGEVELSILFVFLLFCFFFSAMYGESAREGARAGRQPGAVARGIPAVTFSLLLYIPRSTNSVLQSPSQMNNKAITWREWNPFSVLIHCHYYPAVQSSQ